MIKLPEVYLEAVISTAHMSAADNETLETVVLENDADGVYSTEYGYSLYPGEGVNSIMDKLSKGFQSNLVAVFAAGITHLVIDRDGPHVDGLQSWEW